MTAQASRAGESPPLEQLAELFAEVESPLLGYAMKLAPDHDAAQDLVQEAFLRLQGVRATVEHPRAWLFRCVHNLAMDKHRRGKKEVVTDDPVQGEADPELMPDESLEKQEALGLTRLCLEELDQKARDLIRLKFEEDLSYKEISEETGLSVGNVGYRLHYLIKKLGECFRRKEGDYA